MPLAPVMPPSLPAPPPGLTQRLATLAEKARAGQPEARAELASACKMLEGHFLAWLLREMRRTVPSGGLFPRGPTEETYEQLLDDAVAEAVAHGGGVGLARALEAQLTRAHTSSPRRPSESR